MFSKIVSSVSSALDFNLATLSGCIDILVVPNENGELQSTPFHVRFGKAKLLRSREKIVKVTVNWKTTDLQMTLGSAGEAYFIIGEKDEPIADEETAKKLLEEAIKFPSRLDEDDPTTLNVESIEETEIIEEDGVVDLDCVTETRIPADLGESESVPPENFKLLTTAFIPPSPNKASGAQIFRGVQPSDRLISQLDSVPIVNESGMGTPMQVEVSPLGDMQIEASMCGHLISGLPTHAQHDRDVFLANMVQWGDLMDDSHLWFNPSLVFRFEKAPPYFPSRIALPLLTSWLMFKKPLTRDAFMQLLDGRLQFKKIPAGKSMDRKRSRSLGAERDRSGIRNRMAENAKATSYFDASGNNVCDETACMTRMETLQDVLNCFPSCCSPNVDESETTFGHIDIVSAKEPVNIETLARVTNQEVFTDGHPLLANPALVCMEAEGEAEMGILGSSSPKLLAVAADRQTKQRRIRRFRKSLKPTSEQLKAMNLKPGPNAITFSVTSNLQGTKTVTGTIYLWPRNVKVVVSDVDGTITKSDVWGQLMPIVGRDWSHPGVAQLFSSIENSDYRMLYLTARCIGQADSTRDYLFGLTQNEKMKLPDGPLILSPDRLFPTIKREVIDRKPYVFKIAALRDIRNLFPTYYNPFYAGFGNRATDHRAYVHVGIPEARIFIIDATGHVRHVNKTFAKTYNSMYEMAAEMFPPCAENSEIPIDEKFNNLNYWRLDLPSQRDLMRNGSDRRQKAPTAEDSDSSESSSSGQSTEDEEMRAVEADAKRRDLASALQCETRRARSAGENRVEGAEEVNPRRSWSTQVPSALVLDDKAAVPFHSMTSSLGITASSLFRLNFSLRLLNRDCSKKEADDENALQTAREFLTNSNILEDAESENNGTNASFLEVGVPSNVLDSNQATSREGSEKEARPGIVRLNSDPGYYQYFSCNATREQEHVSRSYLKKSRDRDLTDPVEALEMECVDLSRDHTWTQGNRMYEASSSSKEVLLAIEAENAVDSLETGGLEDELRKQSRHDSAEKENSSSSPK